MNETYRQFLLEGQQAGIRYGLTVPRKVQMGLVGSQLGHRSGSSLEFMDHREYMPGDDLRAIDWGAYARSNKLSIKLYRNEVLPHLDLIIDGSRSMALPDTQKARATLGLAALLAQAARNSNYSCNAWRVGDTCGRVANGNLSPVLWDGFEFDACGSCAESFRKARPAWKTRSIRIFISDLMWMGDPHAVLSLLNDQASAVFVIQLLAEQEVRPPQSGNIRLLDVESSRYLDVHVDAIALKRYNEKLANHQSNWNRACTQMGAVMRTVVAEEIAAQWKPDELVLSELLTIL
jgi:uncharacterized protein (DUF58 family)